MCSPRVRISNSQQTRQIRYSDGTIGPSPKTVDGGGGAGYAVGVGAVAVVGHFVAEGHDLVEWVGGASFLDGGGGWLLNLSTERPC